MKTRVVAITVAIVAACAGLIWVLWPTEKKPVQATPATSVPLNPPLRPDDKSALGRMMQDEAAWQRLRVPGFMPSQIPSPYKGVRIVVNKASAEMQIGPHTGWLLVRLMKGEIQTKAYIHLTRYDNSWRVYAIEETR